MLDRISIVGLRVHGRHGVFEHERASGQDFVVDAVLWLDTSAAASADDLGLTADYGAIADRLAAIVGGEPVALIETLADRLAKACLADPVVQQAEVTVHKPHAPVSQNVADIAVTIRRKAAAAAQPAAVRAEGGEQTGPLEAGSDEKAAGAEGRDGSGSERPVVLSVGSNLGDRMTNLQLGLDVLAGGGLILRAVSSVYETDPVGGEGQGDFLNAVLLAVSALPARDILARCAAAEAAAGRVRTVRWGPRTLDVDIVMCGSETSIDPTLTLPHPLAHERAFVLAPWLELDPDAVLIGSGPVAGLLAAVGTSGIRRRPELRLRLPGATEGADPAADSPAADGCPTAGAITTETGPEVDARCR
jgi:dihydroneopterin aldolase/2-amino-4-hydroxy-6-hydroxymethyldihydropteridine diphosphokinase